MRKVCPLGPLCFNLAMFSLIPPHPAVNPSQRVSENGEKVTEGLGHLNQNGFLKVISLHKLKLRASTCLLSHFLARVS